ncbi:MAG: metal ABC transporter substrate-binding protein [Chloroflexota bacterium]|nr:metal ABC transporter substrate-binding protein [Chloroflexota bacterium]
MNAAGRKKPFINLLFFTSLIALLVASCSTPAGGSIASAPQSSEDHEHVSGAAIEMLTLPILEPAALNGDLLQVVATTSIIGDVVHHVGGENIELTTLMKPGQDPHSFEPAAQDLTTVSAADVIFVNGWNLEEALVSNLTAIGQDIPQVPVSAGIAPLAFGQDDDVLAHNTADPHAWFSVENVKQWVKNVQQALTALDPDNTQAFESNAREYLLELEDLERYAEAELAHIPTGNRFLVTNHDSLGYFADEYGFEILGTVIPGASTLAEPSARDMVGLIKVMQAHGICTIFSDSTNSDALAKTVAAELTGCDDVQVLPLYTGATGPAGSGADSYIGMFRANVETIARGLQ